MLARSEYHRKADPAELIPYSDVRGEDLVTTERASRMWSVHGPIPSFQEGTRFGRETDPSL